MDDLRIYLKVKIKSLAAEAAIIRREEAKNKKFKEGLADHRKGIVRSEARHTLLAYGFLRGKAYKDLEPKCHEKPQWSRVEDMIKKYGHSWEFDDTMNYANYCNAYANYCKAVEQFKKTQLEMFKKWKEVAR